jgi:hypothetical protein
LILRARTGILTMLGPASFLLLLLPAISETISHFPLLPPSLEPVCRYVCAGGREGGGEGGVQFIPGKRTHLPTSYKQLAKSRPCEATVLVKSTD